MFASMGYTAVAASWPGKLRLEPFGSWHVSSLPAFFGKGEGSWEVNPSRIRTIQTRPSRQMNRGPHRTHPTYRSRPFRQLSTNDVHLGDGLNNEHRVVDAGDTHFRAFRQIRPFGHPVRVAEANLAAPASEWRYDDSRASNHLSASNV